LSTTILSTSIFFSSFFLITRLSPPSTLFPYTTLFRSPFGRDRLLAVIDPIAILVLGTYNHRASRADRSDFFTGNGAVNAQHVHVIAKHLEIVLRVVTGHAAFVLQHGHSLVGGHRQMAAETRGRPGAVATHAGHS